MGTPRSETTVAGLSPVTHRSLQPPEHKRIDDLYFRTWGRPRVTGRGAWLARNPDGAPRYWGTFHGERLIGAVGITPWRLSNDRPGWQMVEVMFDPLYHGKGLYARQVALLQNDLEARPLNGPLFALPNPSSAPALLRNKALFPYASEVPRWVLWLKPQGTPLARLGPINDLIFGLTTKRPWSCPPEHDSNHLPFPPTASTHSLLGVLSKPLNPGRCGRRPLDP